MFATLGVAVLGHAWMRAVCGADISASADVSALTTADIFDIRPRSSQRQNVLVPHHIYAV
jgi:hypothetical protein